MDLREEQLSTLLDLFESEREYSEILGENERYELFNELVHDIEPEWEKSVDEIVLSNKDEIMARINNLPEEE